MEEFLKNTFSKNRDLLNQKFLQKRNIQRSLSESEFNSCLEDFFLIHSEEWNRISSEKTFLDIYDLLLEICAKRVFQNKSSGAAVRSFFNGIYSSLIRTETENLKEILALSINSLVNLSALYDYPLEEWTETWKKFAAMKTSAESKKNAGFVLAWTLGLANARESAIEKIPGLEDQCFSLIFGFSCSDNEKKPFSEYLSESPWNHPSAFGKTANKEIVFRRFGKAKGLDGGKFTGNPVPFIHQDRIYVYDGENYFRLYSDIFGTVIEAAEKVKSSPSASGRFQWRNGKLSYEGVSADIPEFPTSRTGMTCSEGTAVFFSAYSFSLLIAGVKKYA
ncbi:MAG TPA: hypothetical protein PKV80_13805 [Leptospiraceae bacterium]|nr:hypothetical protein [Leptospiraceae bacterium]HNF25540.1 hypothetical protein [Leptospiraceae bacterium]